MCYAISQGNRAVKWGEEGDVVIGRRVLTWRTFSIIKKEN